MKVVAVYILSFLWLVNVSSSGDLKEFSREYRNEIENAAFHYKDIRTELCKQSARFRTDSLIIGAVVFPEMIRYSIYRDFMETNTMELFYVEGGSRISDFSIGFFQIKPSFVELLEQEAKMTKGLQKYKFITEYKSSDEKGIRKERLGRLKTNRWQLYYMNCFYSLLEIKFRNVKFKDSSEKVRFYATCYNHGFNCSKEEIEKWVDIKTFPNGYNSTQKNYCYADVSLLFYYMLKQGG
jgi:hypothetical protein